MTITAEINTEDQEQNIISNKKVRFNLTPKIQILYKWNTAYKLARQRYWEIVALDRYRFQRRTEHTSYILAEILTQQHRNKIFYQRFYQLK